MKTTERLAVALEEERAPTSMIERARAGYYDECLTGLSFPIIELVKDCRKYNLTRIAKRAKNGDFDATDDEWNAWRQSEEGQQTFRDLFGGR